MKRIQIIWLITMLFSCADFDEQDSKPFFDGAHQNYGEDQFGEEEETAQEELELEEVCVEDCSPGPVIDKLSYIISTDAPAGGFICETPPDIYSSHYAKITVTPIPDDDGFLMESKTHALSTAVVLSPITDITGSGFGSIDSSKISFSGHWTSTGISANAIEGMKGLYEGEVFLNDIRSPVKCWSDQIEVRAQYHTGVGCLDTNGQPSQNPNLENALIRVLKYGSCMDVNFNPVEEIVGCGVEICGLEPETQNNINFSGSQISGTGSSLSLDLADFRGADLSRLNFLTGEIAGIADAFTILPGWCETGLTDVICTKR